MLMWPIVGITITAILLIVLIVFFANTTYLEKNSQEFDDYALNLVNEDRKNRGLSELLSGKNPSAQNHADDLLKNKYFSHWNSDGVKPYATYSLYGGKGLVLENIAKTEWQCTEYCKPNSSDIIREINLHEKNMMYNDAHVNWAHRDTILDPFSTHVNFGIAYDDISFYFVQHFERNLIEMNEVTLDSNGMVTLSGTLPKNFVLDEITIYEDPIAKYTSSTKLNNEKPYNNPTYDGGTLTGIIIPTNKSHEYVECSDKKIQINIAQYDEKKCVYFIEYTNHASKESEIEMSINVSNWLNQNDSIHTMYIKIKNVNDEKTIDATSLTLEYL